MSFLFRGITRKPGEKVRMDGTPIPGAWAYGGVLAGPGDFSIIYGHQDGEPEDTIKKYSVYTDTLGLWTGMLDVDDKKVFSGDVLFNEDFDLFTVVGYGPFAIGKDSSPAAKSGVYEITLKDPATFEPKSIRGYIFASSLMWEINDSHLAMKIVGNIWDMPEFAKFRPLMGIHK